MKKERIETNGSVYFLLGMDVEGSKMVLSVDSGEVAMLANDGTVCENESFWDRFQHYKDFFGFLEVTPLTESEQWVVLELMATLHTLSAEVELWNNFEGGAGAVDSEKMKKKTMQKKACVAEELKAVLLWK